MARLAGQSPSQGPFGIPGPPRNPKNTAFTLLIFSCCNIDDLNGFGLPVANHSIWRYRLLARALAGQPSQNCWRAQNIRIIGITFPALGWGPGWPTRYSDWPTGCRALLEPHIVETSIVYKRNCVETLHSQILTFARCSGEGQQLQDKAPIQIRFPSTRFRTDS